MTSDMVVTLSGKSYLGTARVPGDGSRKLRFLATTLQIHSVPAGHRRHAQPLRFRQIKAKVLRQQRPQFPPIG